MTDFPDWLLANDEPKVDIFDALEKDIDYERNRTVLKMHIRAFYNFQELRMAQNNRTSKNGKTKDEIKLLDSDLKLLSLLADKFSEFEKSTLKDIKQLLKKFPIYTDYLSKIKGVGPTMGGLIISEFDIYKCNVPSHMLKYSGLAVVDGQSDRLRKGQKISFNPRLKAKMLKVLADSFIKHNSPYRVHYDNQKQRRNSMRIPTCQACLGDKVFKNPETKRKDVCKNCNGTGGPAPWGKSEMHRHLDAKRKMMKIFVQDLYVAWRPMHNLPVVPTYEHAKLGIVHGEHADISGVRLEQLIAARPNNYETLSNLDKRLVDIKLGIS